MCRYFKKLKKIKDLEQKISIINQSVDDTVSFFDDVTLMLVKAMVLLDHDPILRDDFIRK